MSRDVERLSKSNTDGVSQDERLYVWRMIRYLRKWRVPADRKCRAAVSARIAFAVLGLIIALPSTLAEEAAKAPAVPAIKGIENLLYLTIKADPASPLLTQANGESVPASQLVSAKFTVHVRISAHSQETNFFGVVPAIVPEFDLRKGSKAQLIWRDGRCHHERGLPKVTVTGVDGLVSGGQEIHSVIARWRQLGLFLPRDEVQASRRMDGGTDSIGSFIATLTETKQTRLLLDLKSYILPCDLAVTTQRPAK
jgi:hypothetical protein